MNSEDSDPRRTDASTSDGPITFSWDGFSQPSTAVAEAVATATRCEPTELEPIHKSIDADALNALVDPGSEDGPSVWFRYEGADVFVDSYRGIEIRLQDPATE